MEQSYLQSAVDKACEAGYRWSFNITPEKVLLDPSFWKCLGESLGWNIEKWNDKEKINWVRRSSGSENEVVLLDEWENQMHCFIDWIISGKDIESFFKDLIPHPHQ